MKKLLLVLLSAVLMGISRLPLHCGWLGFVGLIPLLAYFEQSKHSWRELLRDAFIYSAVGLTIWLHWIWGVTSGGFVGILLLFTIYFFIAFAIIQFIKQRVSKLRYLGFILVFLALEYLLNFSECRFPWINIGYALSDYTILLQAADLGGVSLLSLFLLLANVFIYRAFKGRLLNLAWLSLLLIAWLGYGMWCLKTIPLQKTDAHIALMQPSIPQDVKWENEHFDELYKRYTDLTARAAKDSTRLLIWPEAAVPAYVLRDYNKLALVSGVANAYNVAIFTGFPDVLKGPAGYPGIDYYYNAATLFRPWERYDPPYYKMILVPVGERIPFLKVFPFLWKLQFGQANWEYGPGPRYYKYDQQVFSPQICFEIAFPELNRRMAFRNLNSLTPGKPDKIDFLLNITNDAWFGRSVGPWVHGMMTKFRAVENRIQIDRCANTGISMVVDPLGRIVSRTRLFDITNLPAPLYTCNKVPLYYYLYAWPRLVCLAALLLLAVALLKKQKQPLPLRRQL